MGWNECNRPTTPSRLQHRRQKARCLISQIHHILLILIISFSQLFGSDWKTYYEFQNQPWDTLEIALLNFEREHIYSGDAIDLGCGSGGDSFYLVTQGWNVKAIDVEPIAYEYLTRNIPAIFYDQISFELSSFENYKFPKATLINASYSLPFCPQEKIDSIMQKLTASIALNGRFCGHFLGKNDSWSPNDQLNFVTKEEILNYFKDFNIELLEEYEEDSPSGSGPKHWHLFKVVAKKIKINNINNN